MFKNRAIKKYFRELYPNLVSRYGASEIYTKGQITKTVSECDFNEQYVVYALAIFLEKDDFLDLDAEFVGVNLLEIRAEIACGFFDGNSDYSYKEARSRFVGNEGHCSIGAEPGAGD